MGKESDVMEDILIGKYRFSRLRASDLLVKF